MDDSSTGRQGAENSVILESAWTYDEYVGAYSGLADRMEARQREVRLDVDDQLYFCTLPQFAHMVVVAEPDSPSTIAILPLLVRIARSSPRLCLWALDKGDGMKLLRELVDAPELSQSLSRRELPLVVLLDAGCRYLGDWGPQPAGMAERMAAWHKRHPEWESCLRGELPDEQSDCCAALAEDLTNEMRLWFNSGLAQECVAEIRALLAAVQEE